MADGREKVQSAGTAAEILKALGRLAEPSPLSLVAQAAGMPPAKAHRYLHALIEAGLAEQDALTGRYGLGPELIAISLAAVGRLNIVDVASSELIELRDQIGCSTILSVWGSHGPTVIRVAQSLTAITIVTRLGSVLPLHSATGLVFAAFLPPQALAAAKDHRSFKAVLGGSDVTERCLETVRRQGMSTIDGLLVPGIAALAAPIMNADGICEAVLASLGPVNEFNNDRQGRIGDALCQAAKRASSRMGYISKEQQDG